MPWLFRSLRDGFFGPFWCHFRQDLGRRDRRRCIWRRISKRLLGSGNRTRGYTELPSIPTHAFSIALERGRIQEACSLPSRAVTRLFSSDHAHIALKWKLTHSENIFRKKIEGLLEVFEVIGQKGRKSQKFDHVRFQRFFGWELGEGNWSKNWSVFWTGWDQFLESVYRKIF